MQEKITIQVDKDVYDTIQMLKETIPSDDKEKFNDNEVLKLVLWTFMAMITQEEEIEEKV